MKRYGLTIIAGLAVAALVLVGLRQDSRVDETGTAAVGHVSTALALSMEPDTITLADGSRYGVILGSSAGPFLSIPAEGLVQAVRAGRCALLQTVSSQTFTIAEDGSRAYGPTVTKWAPWPSDVADGEYIGALTVRDGQVLPCP